MTEKFFPLGDIGQLMNYLEYLYHPEKDPSGLSEPDRTQSHISNMEDKVESVLEFLSCCTPTNKMATIGQLHQLLCLCSTAWSVNQSHLVGKETTEFIVLHEKLPFIHSFFWRVMEALIHRFGSQMLPFCDIIEGHMIHGLSWTRSRDDCGLVRDGVYKCMSELLEVSHDINDHHFPVIVDNILHDINFNDDANQSLLEAMKCLSVLLENAGPILPKSLISKVTEGVTNVIVKGSGRNGVVMETATKCLCDLVQLGVPMATGLILEHLSVKNLRCHQKLSRALAIFSYSRQAAPNLLLAGPVYQHGLVESDGPPDRRPHLLTDHTHQPVQSVSDDSDQRLMESNPVLLCNNTKLLGNNTEALSNKTELLGNQTEALGNKTELLGNMTEALGNKTELLGNQTEALGNKTELLSNLTEVLGNKTKLLGNQTEALGNKTEPLGNQTEALGNKTELLGNNRDPLVNEDTSDNLQFGSRGMPILVDSSPDHLMD